MCEGTVLLICASHLENGRDQLGQVVGHTGYFVVLGS